MQSDMHNITKGKQLFKSSQRNKLSINHAFWSLSCVKQNCTRHIRTQAIKTQKREYAGVCIQL